MKFSELTNDQKGAIYPVFESVWTDKNLNGFYIQLYRLYVDSENSKKGSKKELEVIDQLFSCVGTIIGANSKTDLKTSVTQLIGCFPTFIDLICSKDLQKASYTFEKYTDSLVWQNIFNKKIAIYERLISLSELELKEQTKNKKQLIAA
ncbi:hypothetical protein ACE193_06225 [Bernardetia sp. OM2101]|uniref:hypothetical protein n=1 Tax=Bernardetia sp. OM2101 TaxID=3344876 RepID=UPI0035CE985C